MNLTKQISTAYDKIEFTIRVLLEKFHSSKRTNLLLFQEPLEQPLSLLSQ